MVKIKVRGLKEFYINKDKGINYYGLTKDEYINLLKECKMCTKKWTLSKLKRFHKRRLEIINSRINKNKKWFKK